ncbi:Fc receptor-like protein 5 isoform X2 [Tachysurus fulvidraco]|uniref:Fc receptor-like protein 5 isoform X2 n=1 Tax=Tachysurus fulvidraco TaxID=1234273 RepID=UPI001FEDC80D|nr:Fc receptor-like protein 5 isoform X2 [Tachysurus fulvidraco]
MELWTLRMMILLISFFHVGQAQENKPVLYVQPNAPHIFRGEIVTLSCIISGGSGPYSWYKDGVHLHSSAERDYTRKVDQSHRYSCYGLKNGQSTAWSDEVTLSVIERPKAVVTLQPDGEIFSGQEVTLTCEIRGHEETLDVEWMYNWYKDGVLLSAPVGYKYYSFPAFSGKFSCRGQTKSDSQTSETSPAVTLTVSDKPKPELTSDLKGAALTGSSVILSCTLTPQSAGWKFYWIKPTQSSETETHQYIISSVRVSDGGQYKCRAGRGNSVYYTDYSDVLWVNVTESPKALVTIKPDKHVFRGETVTLRCEIQGGGDTEWTYSWYKDDQIYQDHKTQEFSFSSVINEHSGKYTCRGRRRSDYQSSELSDAVTLTVSEKPKPDLTSNLKGAALTGNSVFLFCTLKLQSAGWKFYWIKPTQSSETETETHQYIISSVKVSDGGQYRCRAGRGNPVYYTDYSDVLWVNVIERPKAVVTINPDTHMFRGETVTLRCEIQGGGDTEWTYSWYKDDQTYQDHKTQEFSVSSVRNERSGKYTCRGRRLSDYQSSELSDNVTLTVSDKPKPDLTSNLKGAALTGNSVIVSCTLTPQSAGWKFYWIKPTQSSETETETHQDIISSVRVSDGGQYRCRAGRGNPVYYTDYSDVLWVNVIESPKAVVTIKPDKHVFRGETVTLRCEIQGGGDTEWTYSWYKDDQVYRNLTTQEFSFSSVRNEHSGKYTCRGRRRSDYQISDISDAVTLTVSEKPKPELTSDLKGAALTGSSVFLYCTLTPQSAGWKFYWIKPTQSSETETETHQYIISSVRVSDGGQYRCRAGRGNPVYYTDYSDVLWVNVTESPKAVVTIKPDTHVFRGETVTLRCEIQGGGDTEWIYSWYKDDQIYRDLTTQEFSLSSVINEHSGKYTCRWWRRSDYQSSELSDAVTLNVSDEAKTVMTVSPLIWLAEGDSVTLSCEVKHSSTGWTFIWYKDVLYTDRHGSLRSRTPLLSDSSGGSGGSYTLSPVSLNHTGLYMCRAERGVFHTQYSKTQPLWITGESSPVSLIIRPSRTQHFTADSLSLSCEDQSDSTGWTVRRYSYTETFVGCSSVSGSKCNINFLSTSYTGVYWCQSESGGGSNPVNITVHNGDVILDSPVHPVTEGRLLTLRCLFRNKKIPGSGVDFYKDDSILQNQTTGEMTISNVTKSDEGFYHCKHQERGESLKSWVSVRGRSHEGASMSVLRLISSLVTVSVYLQLTIILAVKCFRARVQTDEDTQNAVIEE